MRLNPRPVDECQRSAGEGRARASRRPARPPSRGPRRGRARARSAEDTNRQLHQRARADDLASRGRRCSSASRRGDRAANVVRHPFWTAGTVARGLAAPPGPATARRAVDHLVRRASSTAPLGTRSPVVRRTRRVGWRSAGLVRSTSAIGPSRRCSVTRLPGWTYQVKVPAGASFVCGCALSPQVWQARPPRVAFTSRRPRRRAEGGTAWRDEVTVSIDPGAQWTDRRWHTVAIPLPADAGARARHPRLALDTSGAGACRSATRGRFSGSRASSGVGGPRKSGDRIQTFARRVRTDGLRSSIELLRTSGIAAHDAEAYARWVARHTPDE